ncbi:MAG TPA: STAS domain-containing protein [Anaerolineae bacterium]
MNITTEQVQGQEPVTVMKLEGELDASTYLDVIARARELYQAGTRNLLLDLSEVPFMSSSGLVALHSIALLMRGQEPLDAEAGWSAMHSIAHDVENAAGTEAHLKLLNPQPRVEKTLDVTGFNSILEVFTDRQAAIDSF